jgi:exodeoxyribonuclease VII large subunit
LHILANARNELSVSSAKLHALSPLATLSRGFAIVTDSSHHVVQSTRQLKASQHVQVRLKEGQFVANVLEIIEGRPNVDFGQ